MYSATADSSIYFGLICPRKSTWIWLFENPIYFFTYSHHIELHKLHFFWEVVFCLYCCEESRWCCCNQLGFFYIFWKVFIILLEMSGWNGTLNHLVLFSLTGMRVVLSDILYFLWAFEIRLFKSISRGNLSLIFDSFFRKFNSENGIFTNLWIMLRRKDVFNIY